MDSNVANVATATGAAATSNIAEAVTAPQTGFLDKVKEFVDPSTIMERLNNNKDTLLAMVLYLGIGFLVGYILKKYFKIIAIIALPLIALFILAQFDMLSVVFNWTKLGATFGIQPLPALDVNLLNACWVWIKSNVALTISGVVGFVVGLRLG